MADKINPDHYKDNPIETCDAIFSQLTEAEKIGALKFNIAKYIFRSGKKVKGLEGYRDDVGKAHWYIERMLKELTDMIKIRQANKQSLLLSLLHCIVLLIDIIAASSDKPLPTQLFTKSSCLVS